MIVTPHGASLIHSSEGTSVALQSKKKSVVTALTMVIDFAPIPIISQYTFFGCLTTDAFAGFRLLICLTDSIELFLVVILVLSYLLVSVVPY
jgi:Na+/serine symporter